MAVGERQRQKSRLIALADEQRGVGIGGRGLRALPAPGLVDADAFFVVFAIAVPRFDALPPRVFILGYLLKHLLRFFNGNGTVQASIATKQIISRR